MAVQLDQEQSKTIYQLLAQRNMEKYHGDVDLLIPYYIRRSDAEIHSGVKVPSPGA